MFRCTRATLRSSSSFHSVWSFSDGGHTMFKGNLFYDVAISSS